MTRILALTALSLSLAAPALACEGKQETAFSLEQWIQIAESEPDTPREALSLAEQVIGASIDLGAQVAVWTEGSSGQWAGLDQAMAGLDQVFDFVADLADWGVDLQADAVVQADPVDARAGAGARGGKRKATVRAARR